MSNESEVRDAIEVCKRAMNPIPGRKGNFETEVNIATEILADYAESCLARHASVRCEICDELLFNKKPASVSVDRETFCMLAQHVDFDIDEVVMLKGKKFQIISMTAAGKIYDHALLAKKDSSK